MSIAEKIMTLTKQLLPSGRAFRVPVGGWFEKLLTGLQASEARAYADAISIQNSSLPDNDQFSTDDASQWERRLGLITNELVSLADRKLAILRKMNHPGTIKARQNYLYLQSQLQAAGFDVYVYENRFPDYFAGYVTKTPAEFSILTFPGESVQYGQIQYGQQQYGQSNFGNKIVNHINPSLDSPFDIGPTFRSTFFIGGNTPGSWAIIDPNRMDEFRQLILKIKPVQMVGYLLINNNTSDPLTMRTGLTGIIAKNYETLVIDTGLLQSISSPPTPNSTLQENTTFISSVTINAKKISNGGVAEGTVIIQWLISIDHISYTPVHTEFIFIGNIVDISYAFVGLTPGNDLVVNISE